MSNLKKLGLAVFATALVPGHAAAQTAPAPAPTSGEEITVTASKRSQKLDTVPGSVQALTTKALEDKGVRDLADLKRVVPSLTALDRGAPGHGSYVIRGINTGPLQESATTAYYLDETPMTFTSGIARGADMAPNPDLSDVARVEILRGPQSTLYGSSALGGLIKVTSNPVDLTQIEGLVSLQGTAIDGGTGGRVRVMENIPLSDNFGVRAIGFYRYDPGFVSNPVSKNTNLNASWASGGRVQFRYSPTENLDSTLSFFYQRMHTFGAATERTKPGSPTPLIGDRINNTRTDNDYRDETWAASWALNYKLPWGTLTNALGYSHISDQEAGFDGTNAQGVLNKPLFGITSPPFDHLTSTFQRGLEKTTEELRFTSDRIGSWEFQLGGFYNHEKYNINLLFRNFDAAGNLLTGSNANAPFYEFLSNRTHGVFKETAWFGNVTYYFTDDLDITLGLRRSSNDQTAVKITTGLLTRGVTPYASGDSSTSYLATLRYRPTQDINFYLRAASAYRPGGPQLATTILPHQYEPDTLWNYEAGVRGSFFGGVLRGGLSVYDVDWRNTQLTGIKTGFSFTDNSHGVRIFGVELDGTVYVSDNFKISGSLSYSDSELKADEPAFGGLKGDPLPLSPKWSGALGVEYTATVFGTSATFGADYSYLGDRYSSFTKDANGNLRQTIPGYGLLSLRTTFDLPEDAQISVRVDNVTDEDGYTSYVLAGGPATPGTAYITRPRTFSVELTKHF